MIPVLYSVSSIDWEFCALKIALSIFRSSFTALFVPIGLYMLYPTVDDNVWPQHMQSGDSNLQSILLQCPSQSLGARVQLANKIEKLFLGKVRIERTSLGEHLQRHSTGQLCWNCLCQSEVQPKADAQRPTIGPLPLSLDLPTPYYNYTIFTDEFATEDQPDYHMPKSESQHTYTGS